MTAHLHPVHVFASGMAADDGEFGNGGNVFMWGGQNPPAIGDHCAGAAR